MDARSASRRCHPDRARHRLRETTEAHGHRPGLSERQPAPPRRSTHRVARARREGWRGRGTRHRRASRAVTARAAVLRGRDVAERALVDLRAGERVVLDVAARHGSGGDLRPADGARGDVRAADAIVGDGARAHGPGSDLGRRHHGGLEGCGPDAVVLGCRRRDGLDVAVEREQADREAGDGDDHLPPARRLPRRAEGRRRRARGPAGPHQRARRGPPPDRRARVQPRRGDPDRRHRGRHPGRAQPVRSRPLLPAVAG